jgi:hypothetical protein
VVVVIKREYAIMQVQRSPSSLPQQKFFKSIAVWNSKGIGRTTTHPEKLKRSEDLF